MFLFSLSHLSPSVTRLQQLGLVKGSRPPKSGHRCSSQNVGGKKKLPVALKAPPGVVCRPSVSPPGRPGQRRLLQSVGGPVLPGRRAEALGGAANL